MTRHEFYQLPQAIKTSLWDGFKKDQQHQTVDQFYVWLRQRPEQVIAAEHKLKQVKINNYLNTRL